MEEFKKLGLSDSTIKALEKKGFTTPTTIQKQAIPLLLEGKKDVVGQSQTGTGKTASFALPIIERIRQGKHVQAIILTPTRELALQVAGEIESLKGDRDLRILAVYGGAAISPQRRKLREGVEIIVGTPGRVMDLQNRGSLKLDNIKYAVLDEADEMLNMGFVEDIETILKNSPKDKTMLLFSATMPKQILRIAKKYMREYEFIEVEKQSVATKNVEQIYYNINSKDRVEGLRRIIDDHVNFYGIIFCNTKAEVDTLTAQLNKLHYSAAALHGDFKQSQREKILQQFRSKRITILVATDVAARGIDVNDLTHVVNYSLPRSPESYVHRIGRTGRAGKKGISITFVIPSEKRRLQLVERVNKCTLQQKELPSAKDIVKRKEEQIKTILQKIIDKDEEESSKFRSMAQELLATHSPREVVAAMLKYSFKNELNENIYKEMSRTRSKPKSKGNRSGGFFKRKKERSRSRSSNKDSSRRGSEGRSKDRFASKGRRDKKARHERNGRSKEGSDSKKKNYTKSKTKRKSFFKRRWKG